MLKTRHCDRLAFSPVPDFEPPYKPLSDEFTEEYFLNTLKRSGRPLKHLLLDQTRVLGLGNIYAVEALFLAGVSPMKAANKLSKPRARKLYQAIRDVLQEAIDAGSTLKIDLADGNSSYIGTSERFWRVYEREGEPCVKCGKRIRRVVQGGRALVKNWKTSSSAWRKRTDFGATVAFRVQCRTWDIR